VFSTLYSECGNKRAGESVPSIVVEDARGAGKNNLLKTPALTQKISPLQDLPNGFRQSYQPCAPYNRCHSDRALHQVLRV
jgi:hypothetical protein